MLRSSICLIIITIIKDTFFFIYDQTKINFTFKFTKMFNFSIEATTNLSTLKPHEEYGGLVFFLQNLPDYLPYSILSVLGTVVGIIGNKSFSKIFFFNFFS